jgi:2-polyprenyl-6-methoxyphenol hydroxylase-like FAD-dependent oxidoreductase
LAQLDLKPAIERDGDAMLGMKFQNARGEHVGEIDLRDSAARFGAPSITIRRAALQRALIDGARREGAALQFGKRLRAIERERATFEDGTSITADLFFGCDGLRSRVRALIMPDAPAPKFTGLLDFGGIVQARGDEPLEPGWMHMVFGKRAFFGVQRGKHGELYWFHNGPDDRILDAHDGDPPFVRDIIARSDEIKGPWPQHDILGLRRWHHGNVCLLGDAAHATTPSAGQGASLALEDAALLARCLREGRDFAAFQASRQQRVNKIVLASRRNGSSKAPSAIGAWFRDRMLSTFIKLGASAQHEAPSYRAEFQ